MRVVGQNPIVRSADREQFDHDNIPHHFSSTISLVTDQAKQSDTVIHHLFHSFSSTTRRTTTRTGPDNTHTTAPTHTDEVGRKTRNSTPMPVFHATLPLLFFSHAHRRKPRLPDDTRMPQHQRTRTKQGHKTRSLPPMPVFHVIRTDARKSRTDHSSIRQPILSVILKAKTCMHASKLREMKS